jgi:hypothetical protein
MTGKKPVGWLGSGLAETWLTLDYPVAEGCLYLAHWVNDDQPYLMDIGGKRLVSIPIFTRSTIRPSSRRATARSTNSKRRSAAVRHALCRGRAQRPGHGDLPAPVPDRRAAPHRRPRRGALLQSARTARCVFATGEEIVCAWLASGATF